MRRALLAFAIVAFVAAGVAQPAGTGQVAPAADNQTGTNETEEPPEDAGVEGESAQFDARLMTAIDTLETLVDIAPNDQARQNLETALETLRTVQENTDTASLGPDGNQTEEEGNESSEETNNDQRQGPPEDRGPGNQGGGPPGFVQQMLGGLFG